MWAGAVTPVRLEIQGATPEGRVVPLQQEHVPAMLKAFDESLVNASDHCVRCWLNPALPAAAAVTRIEVKYDERSGIFEVFNDGPGVPVQKDEARSAAQGRDVYRPEVAFFVLLSGTNMTKTDANFSGGINGIGATLGPIHANKSRVTTVEGGWFYSQASRDRMKVVEAAEVRPARPEERPHTRVQNLPAYRALGYGDPVPPPAHAAEIAAWVRLRCAQLAAYLGALAPDLGRAPPAVTFGGQPAGGGTPVALARQYLASRLTPPQLAKAVVTEGAFAAPKGSRFRFPWHVALALSPDLPRFAHVTLVNGVASSAGPHVNHLRTLLRDRVLERYAKVTKDRDAKLRLDEVTGNLFMVFVAALPGTTIDWGGQRKDEVMVAGAVLEEFAPDPAWLDPLVELLLAHVLQKKQKRRKRKAKPEKYTAAELAGRRRGGVPAATLVVAEGDSAITLLRDGIALALPGGPSFRTHGIFSLGGVPPNAHKMVTRLEVADGEGRRRELLVRSQTLAENRTYADLEQILGLDHECSYESEEEFARLNYRNLVAAVDQDVDGTGKILPILLGYIFLFWPALVARGFVQWFMTPVIRVYPRNARTPAARAQAGAIKEFYFEEQFDRWAASLPGGPEEAARGFHVCYYKGLGGHDDAEKPRMFADFADRLYTFGVDEATPGTFDVFFGKVKPFGAARRAALRTPAAPLGDAEIAAVEASRQISYTLQLRHFAKIFKLAALGRQLPGAVDGLTTGRRKILAGARRKFARGGECQTYQLAGYAADAMSYHLGNASIEGSTVKLCQVWPGQRPFPLVIGSGGFGSRANEGYASPRYTKVCLNAELNRALLPAEDDWLLDYVFVDGRRAEPVTFAPVLPLAPLDNMSIPTEGWNHVCWGRKVSEVLALVRAFCDGADPRNRLVRAVVDYQAYAASLGEGADAPPRAALLDEVRKAFPLSPALRGFRGRLARHNDHLCHVGEWRLINAEKDNNKKGGPGASLVITELPIGKISEKVAAKLVEPPRSEEASAGGKSAPKPGPTDPPQGEGAPQGDLAPSGRPHRSTLIHGVRDHSGTNKIEITVTLKAGALNTVLQSFAPAGESQLSAAEVFLQLHTSLTSNLNTIRPSPDGRGGVLSAGEDYHLLVLHFLPFRRQYYRLRYERRRALALLWIRVETEILRFIDESAGRVEGRPKLPPIASFANEREAGAVLAANHFPRVDFARLRAPLYTKVEDLSGFVVESDSGTAPDECDDDGGDAEGADGQADDKGADDSSEGSPSPARPSYSYILNLRERDLVATARARRAKALEKHRKDLAAAEAVLAEKPFPAASIWRDELDNVAAVLKKQGFWT